MFSFGRSVALVFLFSVAACGGSSKEAKSPESENLAEAPAPADSRRKGTLSFDGETYLLQSRESGDEGAINEYVPEGQTVDDWQTLIGIRHFRQVPDAKMFVGGLVNALKEENPDAPFKIHRNETANRWVLDFVTWDQSGVVEFNIWICFPSPDGQGIMTQQFAARAPSGQGEAFLKALPERRAHWLEVAFGYQFPDIIR